MIDSTSGLKSEAEIREAFKSITPATRPDMFATLTEHGETLTYIPWHKCIEALDTICPGYDYRIVQSDLHICDMPATTGQNPRAARLGFGRIRTIIQLSIPTSDGVIVRDGQGYEPWEKEFYGDPYSNSEAMALRRALAKFGLGLSLYDKSQGGANAAYNGHTAASPAAAATPTAATPAAATATGGTDNPHKAAFPRAQDWKFQIRTGTNKGKYVFDPSVDVKDIEFHLKRGFFKKNPQTQQYDIPDDEQTGIFQAELTRRQGSGIPATPPVTAAAAPVTSVQATVPVATGAGEGKVLPARVNTLAKAAKEIGVGYAELKAKCEQFTNGAKKAPTDLTNDEFDLVCLDILGEPLAE